MNADESIHQAARAVAFAESCEQAADRLLAAAKAGCSPGMLDSATMLVVASAELANRARMVRLRLDAELAGTV